MKKKCASVNTAWGKSCPANPPPPAKVRLSSGFALTCDYIHDLRGCAANGAPTIGRRPLASACACLPSSVWSVTHVGAENRQNRNVFLPSQCVWTARPWANEFTLYAHAHKEKRIKALHQNLPCDLRGWASPQSLSLFCQLITFFWDVAAGGRDTEGHARIRFAASCALPQLSPIKYFTFNTASVDVSVCVCLACVPCADRDRSELASTPPLYSGVWIKYEARRLNGRSMEEAGVCVCCARSSTCAVRRVEGFYVGHATREARHWVTWCLIPF